MSAPGPADPGLQVERTALAWRRTGLALTVLAIGGTRILAEAWDDAALPLGAAGLAVALGVTVAARRRSHEQQEAMRRAGATGRVALPGGGLLAALAAAVVAIGLAALGYAVSAR